LPNPCYLIAQMSRCRVELDRGSHLRVLSLYRTLSAIESSNAPVLWSTKLA